MKHPYLGISEDWKNGGFGLYVHWPFCQSKCPYCDFNSHVAAQVDQSAWIAAYQVEIARIAEQTGPRVLTSIFFGGGTPSLMEARTVHSVIDSAQRAWVFGNDIEITLEANPTSVEAGRFKDYAAAGVNRVSLGVQALNDSDLKRLGRLHSAKEAIAAVELALREFPRVSFDLIYARQEQRLDAWKSELRDALAIGCSHMSLYQLTIEEGTAFGDLYARGKLKGLPDGDLGADFLEMTNDLCLAAGLPRYETSNHARPGEESRHNLIYWRYGDYAGIGPGAHGRLTISGEKWATEAVRSPTQWLARSRNREGQATTFTQVPGHEMAIEMLLMGLRINEGVDLRRLRALDPEILNAAAMEDLKNDGLIAVHDDRLVATRRGIPLLNSLLQALIA